MLTDMKLFASADLHLGKQSSNVLASVSESSVTFTWDRMIQLAIDSSVDALLLSGDIVDRDNRFFEAIGPLQRGFERLGSAGIPVVMVSGNHDYDVLPDIIKNREYDHIHLLGEKGEWESKVIKTSSGALQVVGWSFPAQHVSVDPLQQFKSANLNLDPNLPTVGLLHGDLYDQKSHYAPLDSAAFPADTPHAWVIGHIHKPAVMKETSPMLFYPGSPQAMSSKEPGVHGPFMIKVEGRKMNAKQIGLSPVRYETLQVDVTGADNESAFRDRLVHQITKHTQENADELEKVSRLIYDVVLSGSHPVVSGLDNWAQFVDQYEQELVSETVVTIRKVVNKVRPVVENLEELAKQPTPPGLLAKAILDLEQEKKSPLVAGLVSKIKDRIGDVNRAGTYHPLNRFEEQREQTDESAEELLLEQSRQLLGELLSQKDE